jgi:copper oxidase (laccase) domain-containing protein
MTDAGLTSRLLPVPHGFSVRQGGVSEGPFASLNLGFSTGDAKPAVEENLRRLCRSAELRAGELVTLSQVHGDRVVQAPGLPAAREDVQDPAAEADGVFTGQPGQAVGV